MTDRRWKRARARGRRAALASLLLLGTACDGGPNEAGQGTAAAGPPTAKGPGGLVIREPANPDRPYFLALGQIPYGDVLERTVVLESTEPGPLAIRDIVAGCGCTRTALRWERADGGMDERRMVPGSDPVVLAPGRRAELLLTIDTTLVKTLNMPKLVNVRVRTDSATDPYLTIEVTLTVVQAFQVTPTDLRLGQVPRSGEARARVDIVTFDPDEPEIAGVRSIPDGFQAEITENYDLGHRIWVLSVWSEPPLELGLLRGNVVLGTTGPGGAGEGRDLVVPFSGAVVEDVAIAPTRLQFAPISPEETAQARVEVVALLAGMRLKILSARIEGDASEHLRVDLAPLAPDELGRSQRWTVDLFAAPELPPGSFQGEVVLEIDDVVYPELRIPYGGVRRDA